ncbi:MAG: nicotinate-nucleotide--dimethylbenzimidazole phosphoribosyltransferase [Pseudomonadota bacterium]
MLPHLEIAAPDPDLADRVQAEINAKTKPPGSLGQIERLALQLAIAQGVEQPSARATLLLFAGDHGLVEEGVSAWPAEVTAQMVLNFLAGGAAANVFARANNADVIVADAGVAADLPNHPDLRRAGIRRGTRNSARQDALTAGEVYDALGFGARLATEAVGKGAGLIALGEMGIGNTSSAALIANALAGIPIATLTGPGAGLDAAGIAAKRAILERCAARRPDLETPLDILAAFGGLEIAAMTGAAIGAAAGRAAVVVDGFIATSAAMAARAARPEIAPYLIFAHRSHEPGHQSMLADLGAEPLLDLDLRLGEGSGALLALPLLRAAAAMLAEMATFESASVSGKVG